jgi:hypothetical protein
MKTTLDFALNYISRGLPVFPVWPVLSFERGVTCGCGKGTRCAQPGKHPLGTLAPNGYKDATTDESTVRDWWSGWPDANVAVATGSVIVIDIDPRHGGHAALIDVENKHGKLPQSWRVKTGGGGQHIYFTAPPGVMIKNNTGFLGNGIDVRGQGGYVLAPPSGHASGGRYEWEPGKDLALMPEWLVATLRQPRQTIAAPAQDWSALVRDGVVKGQRNAAATRLAGHLLRRYVDPVVTLELILAWNAARCMPPLSPDEVIQIVNSIAGRELARRRAS